MAKRIRTHGRRSGYSRDFKRQRSDRRIPHIKPGADSKLKKVFQTIGTPSHKPFKPDPFQIDAIKCIAKTDCLVTAPTGSGKTWIAQQAIEQTLKKAGRSWYASPLKALSNAKYDEFKTIFGAHHVGILTGDRKENPDASVIVGTTEILRNQLYDVMHHGENLAVELVVLDEAHFLGDPERGVVWEEIMIYLPSRIPLLLLSATIGNAHQIADWLSTLRRRKCQVVEEHDRSVPLFPLFFHPTGTLYPFLVPGSAKGKKRIYKKVLNYVSLRRPPVLTTGRKLPPFGEMLKVLRKYRLLPAIFFLKSRADCNGALERCLDNRISDPSRRQKIQQRVEAFVSRYPHIGKHRQRWALEQAAVGSHHSGQLPVWKLLVEKLMTAGLLDAVFATSTVAAGVNFPARSVVFFNSDRFNGIDFSPLTSTEFHQMTGRAGRRGMDNIGFALLVPGKFMDIRRIAQLVHSAPTDVNSQIKINFSMVLNLLLSHVPGEVEQLLDRSFANYQILKVPPKKKKHTAGDRLVGYLWQDFEKHLTFLQNERFVTPQGRLTDDGLWASHLRVDQPLLLAEGFRQGIFPDTDPALMAAIIAACINERDTTEPREKVQLARPLIDAYLKAERGLRPFLKRMIQAGFTVRPLALRPAAAVYVWATHHIWEAALDLAEMEEGLFASFVLRTADNLRHIRHLGSIFPQASVTAAAAIDELLQDPILIYF